MLFTSQHRPGHSLTRIGPAFQRFSQRQARLFRRGAPAAALVDLLFPPACLGCRGRPEAGAFLCAPCSGQLSRPDPDVLRGLPPAFRRGIDDAVAPWYTEPAGPAREIVHAIKYGYARRLAFWAGLEAAAALRESDAGAATSGVAGATMVVPVPIHRARQAERGFNQALLIARGVSAALGRPLVDALGRRGDRWSQTTATAAGRRTLPSDTFFARRPVPGANVILVDDVITTGSTVNAAACALREAGAERVVALSLAVSRRPGSP